MSFLHSKVTPWSSLGEIAVWIIGMVIAAFLIHNMIRLYKASAGG